MRLDIIGKSVRGASHVRSGTGCQDSMRKIVLEDGTAILAVADGHGSESCLYSKTGSQIAVNTFCDVLKNLYLSSLSAPEQLATYLNREGETKVAQMIEAEWKRRVLKRHTDMKRESSQLEDGSKDVISIYRQYGTTLLGLMLTETYLFAFQLGDGNIGYADDCGYSPVLTPEKILGVETHSLCRENAWRHAISTVRRLESFEQGSCAYMLSTDGFANGYKDEATFELTCADYFKMLKEHGVKAVADNLPQWLTETSELGCGDDITLLIAYWGYEVENSNH